MTAPQGHRSRARNTAAGGAWVVFGSRRRTTVDLRRLGTRGRELRGRRDDWAGFAVAVGGRVDGDRVDDLALLAGGSIAVVRGRRGTGTLRLDALATTDGLLVDGHVEPGDFYSVPGLGGLTTVGPGADLDGAGGADVVAGALAADHNERAGSGSAYVFFDPAGP